MLDILGIILNTQHTSWIDTAILYCHIMLHYAITMWIAPWIIAAAYIWQYMAVELVVMLIFGILLHLDLWQESSALWTCIERAADQEHRRESCRMTGLQLCNLCSLQLQFKPYMLYTVLAVWCFQYIASFNALVLICLCHMKLYYSVINTTVRMLTTFGRYVCRKVGRKVSR